MIASRIRQIRKALGMSQQAFADAVHSKRSTINGYERGVSLPSADVLKILYEEFSVNIAWILTGSGQMFHGKSTPLGITESMAAFVRECVEPELSELRAMIENLTAASSSPPGRAPIHKDEPDSSGEAREAGPEYLPDEPVIQVPYGEGLAAGEPREAVDTGETYPVPLHLIRGDRADYYAAKIKGTSMVSAGIPDGGIVLLRRQERPVDGSLMVVDYQGSTTLKRLHLDNGGKWVLLYGDGSGRKIYPHDGEWAALAEFVVLLWP